MKITLFKVLRVFVGCFSLCFLNGCVYTSFDLSSASLSLDSLWSDSKLPESNQLAQSRPRFFLPPPRAKRLPAPNLELRSEVQHELSYVRRTSLVERAISRNPQHVRVVREILHDEGLPADLLALALIESGLNARAKSHAGAVGLWQLMKSTARLYDLSVNFFTDERSDPVLSTLAAARHLKDLFYLYDDWHLALAAYNAGTGRIDRALMRTGTTNFWQLARTGALRKETVRFVPRFIAVALILREKMDTHILPAEAKVS